MIVITGGQTGADQAGWHAAKAAGLETTGWMPKGFLTEDGPRPEFADLYGAREMVSTSYPNRRRTNLKDSHGAVVFNQGTSFSPGTNGLLSDRKTINRPVLVISTPGNWPWIPESMSPDNLAKWLVRHRIETLMIAGNRESSAPGIGRWIEQYLAEVFRMPSENSKKGT